MNLVRVFINGNERIVAAGLRVRSLFSQEELAGVQRGDLVVIDVEGRERGLDGALRDGLVLFLQPRSLS